MNEKGLRWKTKEIVKRVKYLVVFFFSPASFLEFFELGPIFCPNAQRLFLFSSEKKKKLLLEKSKYNSVAGEQVSNVFSQKDSKYRGKNYLLKLF